MKLELYATPRSRPVWATRAVQVNVTRRSLEVALWTFKLYRLFALSLPLIGWAPARVMDTPECSIETRRVGPFCMTIARVSTEVK